MIMEDRVIVPLSVAVVYELKVGDRAIQKMESESES